MALTIGQAKAMNALCGYLLGPQCDGGLGCNVARARSATAMLADQAHKSLGAGWTGDQVRGRWTIGAVMPADTALELLEALGKYSARIGRQCEVSLRPDASCDLMGAEDFTQPGEPATGFEAIEEFDSLAALRAFLGAV